MSETYKKPKTMDELRWFCDDHNIPAREMRFFIDEDFKEPKAFGIYRDDDGDFVVYKNKADGSRSVRYKGPDEAFAVNELYEKMKAETEQRKAAKRSGGSDPGYSGNRSAAAYDSGSHSYESPGLSFTRAEKTILAVILIVGLLGSAFVAYKIVNLFKRTPNSGYYAFNGTTYYDEYGSWYYYDDYYEDWYPIDYVDQDLIDNYEDYYLSYNYDDSYGVSSFGDTYYFDSDSSSSGSSFWDYFDDDDDYDWDDDDDWDWDYDYDYDDTDWDSDW